MKKTLRILIILILGIAVFSVRISAAESVGAEYILTESEGVYTLSMYDGGRPVAVRSGALSEVLLMPSGSSVMVDGVTVYNSFDFPSGEYRLSGELQLSGGAVMTVPTGTVLDMVGFTLTSAGSGYIRIKGGTLSMRESFVACGEAGAIRLDYSSSSRLTLISTGISSSSVTAAVTVDQGNAYIGGGYVKNSAGPAVSADSGLYLYGAPEIRGVGYDIIAEKPLTLSHGGQDFCGAQIRVKYGAIFESGEMSEILYRATADSTSRVKLFDESGKEHALTYFADCPHTQEKNFAAVYLPYSVRIKQGNTTIRTEYRLAGELMTPLAPDERRGYEFAGWYRDGNGGTLFDFTLPITADTEIYAVYSLMAPEFSVSSLRFVYDGAEHSLCFAELSHPLDGEGGFYSYKWYKGDTLVSTAATVPIRQTSDSGVYSCLVAYNFSSDTSVISAGGISVTVERRAVAPPEIQPIYYDGSSRTPAVTPSSLYSFAVQSGTDAGKYKITYTLTDSDNYCFEGAEGSVLESEYEILRAENSWVEELYARDSYIGSPIICSATPMFGSARILYSTGADGEYSTAVPDKVGVYYAKAVVDGTDNYTALTTSPVRFSVLAERVVDLKVKTQPTRLDYTALTGFSPLGLTLLVTYDSGREAVIGSDSISYSYQNGATFKYGDTAVIVSYGGVSVPLPVRVSRAGYDISGVVFSSDSLPYNGKYQTLTYGGNLPTGLDGIPLTATVEGGGSDAGSYKVILRFFGDSPNYNLPAPIEATLTVERKCVRLEWGDTEFVYDGAAKQPSAVYTDVFGVQRSPRVGGEAAGAGKYTATATAEKNYLFENPSAEFEILRADYDFSSVYWIGTGFVYDGTEKSVSISGLPDGVKALGYTDARATDAGEYVATAALSYDSKNYNPPPTLTYSWSIAKAEYPLGGFSFVGGSFVYDGREHYPTLVGEMPLGLDGTALKYRFTGGVARVAESGSVGVEFYTESKNYRAPESVSVTVTVLPKEISVIWGETEHTYDGEAFLPTAVAEECEILVNGAQTESGEYTATAVAKNTDYIVKNARVSFVIKKAENRWTRPLTCNGVFEGETPSPHAESLYGTVEYKYFSDAALTVEIEPKEFGIYYAVAFVGEGDNHLSIFSDPVEFEIKAVVPIDLTVVVSGKVVARAPVKDGEFVATAHYNNGTSVTLSAADMEIIYQNGSTPGVGDEYIEFRWSGFSRRVPVTVVKADYDMSGVLWSEWQAVYDGEEKYAVLVGLPEGVTVSRYEGNGAVNAGEYTVVAHLAFDELNYNAPESPTVTLVISRAPLPYPELAPHTYDGSHYTPISDSPLYCFSGGGKNAGSYTVTAAVTDAQNYCFEDGGASAELPLLILPRRVCISLDTPIVYLDGNIPTVDYTITDGSFVDGEEIVLTQSVVDGRVVLTLDNSNYELSVAGGDIEYLNRPSPERERSLLLVAALALLLIVAVTAAVVKRDSIATLLAIVRCRIVSSSRRTAPSESLKVQGTEQPGDSEWSRPVPITGYIKLPRSMPQIPVRESKVEAIAEEDTADPVEHDEQESVKEDNASAAVEAEIKTDPEPPLPIDAEHADALITDALARDLMRKSREVIFTEGSDKVSIGIDAIARSFAAGERVDVNSLKERGLVSDNTAYLRILGCGSVDKPLLVYANEFALTAIKMIALTGGEAVRITTAREKNKK